jgi:uncharacterized membrane protein HdeD (DUF308 family)
MNQDHAAVCIPNLSLAERRKRLVAGAVTLLFGLAVLAVMLAAGLHPAWRLGLFPILAGAASGFFQWRDQT